MAAITALFFEYASSRVADGDVAQELMLIIDQLAQDFADDSSLNTSDNLLAGLNSVRTSINPAVVTQATQQFLVANNSVYVPANIDNILDSDLDGAVNALDSDDDNDQVADNSDATPYGVFGIQPACSNGNRFRDNPLLNGNGVYHIQSLFKADQYLNVDAGLLRASPVQSQFFKYAHWRLTKVEGVDNQFTINLIDTDFYLSVITENVNQPSLGLSRLAGDHNNLWAIELRNAQRPDQLAFHIRNVANPTFFLDTSGQKDAPLGAVTHLVDVNNTIRNDQLGSVWAFCEVRQALNLADQPQLPPINTLDNVSKSNQPLCSVGQFDDPRLFRSETFHIQNALRTDQYINRHSSFRSSQILNREAKQTRWRIERADAQGNYFIISELDGLYLYFDNGDIRLGRENIANAESLLWQLEHVDDSNIEVTDRDDIGAVSQSGSLVIQNGIYIMQSSGPDIWSTADAFYYFNQSIPGDGQVTMKINGLSNTDFVAKAGVMIRESLEPNARNAYFFMQPQGNGRLQYRLHIGDLTRHPYDSLFGDGPDQHEFLSFPVWIRLTREGNLFTAYSSNDGVCWIEERTQTVDMTFEDEVFFGMALAANNPNQIVTTTFSDFSISPKVDALTEKCSGLPGFMVLSPPEAKPNEPLSSRFRIRSRANPSFYLTTRSQVRPASYLGIDSDLLQVRDDNRRSWESSQWQFCRSEQ